MNNTASSRSARRLSWLIVALAIIAAASGLLWPEIYLDNAFVRTAWLGNDLITLFVAVPALSAALVLFRRGVRRAVFVWLGLLGYMVYNYAFYLFGAHFNVLFLLYAALFILPVYALILLLGELDIDETGRQFSSSTPVRWISVALLFIVVPLSIMELGQILNFFRTGQMPSTITETGHPTSIVFALDLSIVAPAMYLAAILLWQRRPWGFILAVMMAIKGFSYMLVLVLSSALIAGFSRSGSWDPFLPFYLFTAVVCAAAGSVLLHNYNPRN